MIPKGSMYCLEYKKNTIVKALPGTFGIMVFKTKAQAIQFANAIIVLKNMQISILKVRVIGRGRKLRGLSSVDRYGAMNNTSMFKKFYKFYHAQKHKKDWWSKSNYIIGVPPDTECYPAVEVLN